MKFSFNWLKNHVSVTLSAEELSHKLTMAGLEVEAIHTIGTDKIFEIEVTPNRADCLCVEGLAREVGAILNKTRKHPRIATLKLPKVRCNISIEDKRACQRYIGTLIEGVRVGPADMTIKKHLDSLEARSISNIVDITNFCLIEMGQPLHAFDYDKLNGGKIIVRRAKKGEKITTIDDQVHELDESILVIADEKTPVAIAGIMGGKGAEVTAHTKNILLESAYFDPVLIRRASRKLGVSSDSSYRFERGVDREGVKRVSERAVTLILGSAGGKITRYTDLNVSKASKRAGISITTEKIANYLGADISSSRCQGILKKLDFKTRAAGRKLTVVPPSHRPDIKADVDIIEEIARIEGYDKLPVSFPTVKISSMHTEPKRSLREKLKSALVAQGFDEIITYSMTNQDSLRKAKQSQQGARITNPLSMDQEMMRPSLLPGILNVVSFNVNRGQKNLRLFETGKIYQREKEVETLGLALLGVLDNDWRRTKETKVDFYDLKGALVAATRAIVGEKPLVFIPLDAESMERGQSAEIMLADESIGRLGKLEREVLHNFTIKETDVWFAQLNLEAIYAHHKERPRYKTISSYPAIVRDISFTFDKNIPYRRITDTISENSSKNLIEINFKEDYTNIIADRIDTGHRGVLISLTYQSPQRTLAEDEVNAEHQAVLKLLTSTFKVKIR